MGIFHMIKANGSINGLRGELALLIAPHLAVSQMFYAPLTGNQ